MHTGTANLLSSGKLSGWSCVCSVEGRAPLLASCPHFSETNIMRSDRVSSWEHIQMAVHVSFTSHMTMLTCKYFHATCILELLLFNDITYCKWCFSCALTSEHHPLSAASSNLLLYKHPCLPATSSPRRWVRKSVFHLSLCSQWHCFNEKQAWKAFTISMLWELATRHPIPAGL